MTINRTLLLLLCLVLAAGSASAARVEGLYSARTEVEDQTTGKRLAGFVEALQEVLIRVSGDRAIASDPRLADALAAPSRFVERYRYEKAAGDNTEAFVLVTDFSARALQALLVQNQLPVWSEQRPDTLLWIAVEARRQRYMLAGEQDDEVVAAFEQAARRRGLPLIWPRRADLDGNRVTVSDIRAGFRDQIAQVSVAYSAQAILIGHLVEQKGGNWTASWQLLRDERSNQWQSEIVQQQAAIGTGVDVLADLLSAEFAVPGGNPDSADTVLVRLEQVADLQAYAKSREYLENLLLVASAKLLALKPDYVDYALTLRGSREEFLRRLSLDGRLHHREQVAPLGESLLPGAGAVEPVKAPGEPDLFFEYRPG